MKHDNDTLWRFCVLAAERMDGHRLSEHKFNFKCNVCGDGHRKRRGYLVFDTSRDLIYYKCFNEGDCDAAGDGNTWHASKWLKYTDPNLYQAYRAELKEMRLRNLGRVKFKKQESKEKAPEPPKPKTDLEKEFDSFLPIKKCPDCLKEPVKNFCLDRMIPKDRIKEFRVAVNGKYRGRIIIPAFDENHKLIYFQARALLGQTPKYLNSVAPRENVVYGLDRVDKNKPVIVLEGPIDSMFVENGVATMGCSYSKEVQEKLDKLNCLYLMDNDRAGNSKSRELLNDGHKVFLWSKFLGANCVDEKTKDLNEYVVTKKTPVPISFDSLSPFFSKTKFDVVYLTK